MKKSPVIPLMSLIVAAMLALPAMAEEMRTFVDDAGNDVRIPVSPQRIVSMRGEQFTAPLVELGAPLVASSGRTDEAVNKGEPYPRGAYDLFGTTVGDDLTWIGSPGNPDLEAIAAVNPDLILIPDWQTDLLDPLQRIAPTVVIGIWSNPMLERYRKIADAAGKLDEFEERQRVYEQKLAVARAVVEDRLGDPSAVSVAIAEVFDNDLYVYRDYGAMSQALRDLGFSMPDLIAQIDDGNAQISPEILPQINADFMIGTYNLAFGAQAPSDRIAAWEALIPTWDEMLHAPRHNQHILLNREPMRALSFRSLEETMSILLSHLSTRDFVPLND